MQIGSNVWAFNMNNKNVCLHMSLQVHKFVCTNSKNFHSRGALYRTRINRTEASLPQCVPSALRAALSCASSWCYKAPRRQFVSRWLIHTWNCPWQSGVSSTGNNMCTHSLWRFWKAEETFERVNRVNTVLWQQDEHQGIPIWQAFHLHRIVQS